MMNVVFEKSDTFANLFMDRNSVREDITYNHFIGINDAEYLYDFFDENEKYFDSQYFKARSKNGEYDIYDFLDEVEEDFNTHMEIYLGLEKQTLDIDNVFEDDTHYYFETDKFNGVKKVDNFLGKEIQFR